MKNTRTTTPSSMKRNTELLFEIGAFRHVHRVWRQFLCPDVANCAEHSFRVAWIALTLAKNEKSVDDAKLLKMALVHDLAESRAGDVHYLSRQYAERKEIEAVKDIFEDTIFQGEMDEIIAEYEERRSIEAKIVKDADNIDVELELAEMRYKGHSLGTVWTKSRKEKVFSKLYTETAKKFWLEIHKTNPHNWHLLSEKNRFNAGDWKKSKDTKRS